MPFFFVHKIFSRKLVACAAMVVILLGGGLAVWQQQDKAAEEQVVQGGAQEIKVPKGMKERIILADGTKVWLNSGSCLTLSPGFGQTDRELQLEGEGMFEVAKDKHKPFIIRSGDIRVRVTGTVFNFKSYPEERFAKVTLVRGSMDVTFTQNGKRFSLALPVMKLARMKKLYNSPPISDRHFQYLLRIEEQLELERLLKR